MIGHALRSRVQELQTRLRRAYPEAQCALNFTTPLELLIATILSAQCTDVRVNLVTPALFQRYRTAADYAAAEVAELERTIQTTGFYRQKARTIQSCCSVLLHQYHGEVPDTMEALVALPGVGRKTANVVLGNAFGRPEGIAVDTHVQRLAHRLGLTSATTPEKIEEDLLALVPRNDWTHFSHLLISHGRAVCKARAPACAACPVYDLCPAAQHAAAG
jgi:endonuclease-3